VSSVSPSPTLMSYLSARLNGGVRWWRSFMGYARRW
jgi:hypothetical protein